MIPLHGNRNIYSCRSYLVLGDWNRIEDLNTLVDTGSDGSIIGEIEKISTGVGKNPVAQIIMTHSHFDHSGGILPVKKKYGSRVYAFAHREGVDELLKNGQKIKMGDRYLEVIHTPGHSTDSICLYCAEQKLLFSGDTLLRVMAPGGSYTHEYVSALEKIAGLDIDCIFSGHDEPLNKGACEVIRNTMLNVKKSRLVRKAQTVPAK